ncbi:MAG: DUF1127 domain-containing protein [Magnetospiraceae bacterium]
MTPSKSTPHHAADPLEIGANRGNRRLDTLNDFTTFHGEDCNAEIIALLAEIEAGRKQAANRNAAPAPSSLHRARMNLDRVSLHIAETLWDWTERRRQRRDLGRLSGSHLKDIGLTPAQAFQESAKPFWKL